MLEEKQNRIEIAKKLNNQRNIEILTQELQDLQRLINLMKQMMEAQRMIDGPPKIVETPIDSMINWKTEVYSRKPLDERLNILNYLLDKQSLSDYREVLMKDSEITLLPEYLAA